MECPLPDKQLVQHAAQTVDVAATIDTMALTACLLGRHVGRRPGIFSPRPNLLLFQRQAEVDQVGSAVLAQQDVARFHVTVDQPLFVGVMQSLSNRANQFDRLAN